MANTSYRERVAVALANMEPTTEAHMYLEGEGDIPVKIKKTADKKVIVADTGDLVVDMSKTYMYPHMYVGRYITKIEPLQGGGARSRNRKSHRSRKSRKSHKRSRSIRRR